MIYFNSLSVEAELFQMYAEKSFSFIQVVIPIQIGNKFMVTDT